MYDYGVYIGRFQPFHQAHLLTVQFALQHAKELIIVIGSSNQARTVKNPWTSKERILMILAALAPEERARVQFIEARDYLYNNNFWVAAVQQKINQIIENPDSRVVLVGHKKDESSFYLKLFPQWTFLETGIDMPIDATKIRELMFRQDKIGIKFDLPAPVYDIVYNFMSRKEFDLLHEEYHFLIDYRRKHSWPGLPYEPVFLTTDAVVIGMGHVLVVRRGGFPGKGLIALPGGFLQKGKTLFKSALSELKEETVMSMDDMSAYYVEDKVFDHPQRSLRGRTVTQAFCFNLDKTNRISTLPRVKGADDADKAWWMPLNEVNAREDEFFEDHYHIINYFASRVGKDHISW